MYVSWLNVVREGGWSNRAPWRRSRDERIRRSFWGELGWPRRRSRVDIRRDATVLLFSIYRCCDGCRGTHHCTETRPAAERTP